MRTESTSAPSTGHRRSLSKAVVCDYVSITVFIKCGSRNETEQTSGAAHFLEHLHFKGTGKRSRVQLELDVENMGGQLNAYTSRENTSYTINCFSKDTPKACDILGDMLTNSLYSNRDIELERDTIYRELYETRKMQFETTIEISHRGVLVLLSTLQAYKTHQMALPILGKITNMYSISRDMIVDYHRNNYFGENFIVIGCGNIKHEDLCEQVAEGFKKVYPKPAKAQPVSEKPQFQSELFLMQSELTDQVNATIFYEAPPWDHPHYYDFLLFQRLLDDRPENQFESLIYLCTALILHS